MLYVSWTSARQHGADNAPYSIAYAESSYCADTAACVVDASESPLWSRHVGRDVELAFTTILSPDAEYHEHQVLEIRSGTDRSYLSIRWVLTASGFRMPYRPSDMFYSNPAFAISAFWLSREMYERIRQSLSDLSSR